MKRLFNLIFNSLFSMQAAAVLLLLIAFACAAATFIEADPNLGTQAARALVYNHWWFEATLFLLCASLVGNMIKFRMFRKEKTPTLIFHASIVIILLGAFITRYFGYEGLMHIREGETSSSFFSSDPYLKVSSSGLNASQKLSLSPIVAPTYSFSAELGGGAPVTIETKAYYPRAKEAVVPLESGGKPYISFLVGYANGAPAIAELFYGEFIDLGGSIIVFGEASDFEKPAIVIDIQDDQPIIRAYSDLMRSDPETNDQIALRAHAAHPFEPNAVYNAIDGVSVVLREYIASAGRKAAEANPNEQSAFSALIVDVSHKGERKEAALLGGVNMGGDPVDVELAGRTFTLSFGSEEIGLPFSLRLDRFAIERYPGSSMPSSYESQVTLIDADRNINESKRIYMNNILVHRQFRFYQHSYDRDERGTVLSVSNDPGVWLTYIGYAALTIGFFIAFFSPNSRFRALAAQIEKNRIARSFSACLVALFFVFGAADIRADEANATRIMGIVDANHAKRFGTLLVQDSSGRIKPIDTLAREALSKISKKTSIAHLSATQVFLGMLSAPKGWQQVKMIRLNHPDLGAMLGLEQGAKEAAFADFFGFKEDGEAFYKLDEITKIADRTPDSQKTLLQQELVKVLQRVDTAYMIYQGYLMRVIPVKGDPAFAWVSPPQMLELFSPDDAKETAQTLYEYVEALKNAQINGEWSKADLALDRLQAYQETHGAAVIPSADRVKAEILLNSLNPFFVLLFCYLALGTMLLVWAFTRSLAPNFIKEKAFYVSASLVTLISLAFIFHATALGFRWYVSGHAPWSNGYESIVYISWTALLAGLFFAKRSVFALPAAALIGAFALMAAHLSAMDPQITTLVPVLKSRWLTIHVSVISASYGFLGLSMLLGLIALTLFIFRAPKKTRIDEAIAEIKRINEMSMMAGLALLSIGNIFGAIWANESWGRYWSWDPKETWTLVSMLIYAAILHFRFIPALKSVFTFSLASAWGFFSILMTYFGVNYYLSGMHSYANGDSGASVDWILIVVISLFGLTFFAFAKSDGRYPLECR
ncbi:MAG: cytochrome c biogenesis protein CcsA [Helicobacteraceae bacterium]|jgi:cytochrome c-type biogenesis protein CcsB|nr:cytochrome c biogenesis protein CcsA [Helicobacteraceae bacterium]